MELQDSSVGTLTYIRTKDGSLTASLAPNSESMHSTAGASRETVFVYGPAVDFGLEWAERPRFFSVGMGLGYVELLIASKAILAGKQAVEILSFEREPRLRSMFLSWVRGEGRGEGAEAEGVRIAEDCAEAMARATGVEPQALQAFLARHEASGAWRVLGELSEATQFSGQADAILYDLFSAASDGGLWEEDFLKHFLSRAAGHSCAFATYAARSALRRALRAEGFVVERRPGFAYKRESTFAVKRAGAERT